MILVYVDDLMLTGYDPPLFSSTWILRKELLFSFGSSYNGLQITTEL